jgi:hypothetical protein
MIDLTETKVLRCYEDDKTFFVDNEKLEKYLTFKHQKLIKKQEDLFSLIRKELEENMSKKN